MPYDGPTTDHGLLSPNGRISKAARRRAEERERARLFPVGTWDTPAKSEEQKRAEQKERNLRVAQELRDLATRGVGPRKHIREAERLEREAAGL